MIKRFIFYLIVTGMCALSYSIQAKNVAIPDDPRQSLAYWKTHVVDVDQDERVKHVHDVFSVLLRTWDGPQLAPHLYIVESTGGPWAASLADGNILMSRAAVELCFRAGPEKASHLLAFILGHELAHQKADDLWHQKFLRLAGRQTPETERLMLRGLALDEKVIRDMENREAQTDHDGLVMMASVGYDPFAVIDDHDFFSRWVEHIWKTSCRLKGNGKAIEKACQRAATRAVRTRAQLKEAAVQSLLFDLGIQSYIAGQFERARYYFVRYGKRYPSRSVYTNIGITYLAQAIAIEQKLAKTDAKRLLFYYPLALESQPFPGAQRAGGTRGGEYKRLQELKQAYIDEAVKSFNQAIRLDPQYRLNYIYLAMGYLLVDNTFMVRGVLQGQYEPRFKQDTLMQLLLHMTAAREGQVDTAEQALSKMRDAEQVLRDEVLEKALIDYAIHYNYTVLLEANNKRDEIEAVWQRFAKQVQQEGRSEIFRLALAQLNVMNPRPAQLNLDRDLFKLGSVLSEDDIGNNEVTELWLDGEVFRVVRKEQGLKLFLNRENNVISVWQDKADSASISGLSVGDERDRPFKLLGMPSRHIHFVDGEYLAYDELNFAIRLMNNRVAGWFHYKDNLETF